ncbi:unnamed protein product [Caenorhabditis brenneri]
MNLDYKKADRNREMEFTLLFLLTVEMLLVVFGYYTMDTTRMFNNNNNNNVQEWFFISWALNLSATPLLAMLISAPNFALYRVGFRIIHLSTIVYIFYHSQQMVVSEFVVGFCFLEFVYLVVGVSNGKMPFPGIIFSESLYSYSYRRQQEAESHVEKLRGSDNMNFCIDTDENNSSDEEELFDDPCYIPSKKDSSLKIC